MDYILNTYKDSLNNNQFYHGNFGHFLFAVAQLAIIPIII